MLYVVVVVCRLRVCALMSQSCHFVIKSRDRMARYQRHGSPMERMLCTMSFTAIARKLNRSASDPVFIALELSRNAIARAEDVALFFKRPLSVVFALHKRMCKYVCVCIVPGAGARRGPGHVFSLDTGTRTWGR